MFERFTERARKVIVLAQEEARYFNHNYIGTEHLLLGLLREEEGVAAHVLGSLNVTLELVREQVESVVGDGEGGKDQRLPFTPSSKKTQELAMREALYFEHDYVGTEHLLLGLARVSEGHHIQVLSNLGVEPAKVRRELLRMLVSGRPQQRRRATSGKTIDDLVGQHVSVAVENMGKGEPGRFKCTLEGTDDRGIVVSYQSNASKITRFYPWHAVTYINLAKLEDSGKPPRRAGFQSA